MSSTNPRTCGGHQTADVDRHIPTATCLVLPCWSAQYGPASALQLTAAKSSSLPNVSTGLLSMRKSICGMGDQEHHILEHLNSFHTDRGQSLRTPVRSPHSRMVAGRTHSAASLPGMHLQAMVQEGAVMHTACLHHIIWSTCLYPMHTYPANFVCSSTREPGCGISFSVTASRRATKALQLACWAGMDHM
jgi:hypothetical protein